MRAHYAGTRCRQSSRASTRQAKRTGQENGQGLSFSQWLVSVPTGRRTCGPRGRARTGGTETADTGGHNSSRSKNFRPRASGGIGRRTGLKIPWPFRAVGVRIPPRPPSTANRHHAPLLSVRQIDSGFPVPRRPMAVASQANWWSPSLRQKLLRGSSKAGWRCESPHASLAPWPRRP